MVLQKLNQRLRIYFNMTNKKTTRELNPLEQSIKEFLKDQDDYGRYLEKLREKEKLPEPKDFKKLLNLDLLILKVSLVPF